VLKSLSMGHGMVNIFFVFFSCSLAWWKPQRYFVLVSNIPYYYLRNKFPTCAHGSLFVWCRASTTKLKMGHILPTVVLILLNQGNGFEYTNFLAQDDNANDLENLGIISICSFKPPPPLFFFKITRLYLGCGVFWCG